jgi:hypothetical protein
VADHAVVTPVREQTQTRPSTATAFGRSRRADAWWPRRWLLVLPLVLGAWPFGFPIEDWREQDSLLALVPAYLIGLIVIGAIAVGVRALRSERRQRLLIEEPPAFVVPAGVDDLGSLAVAVGAGTCEWLLMSTLRHPQQPQSTLITGLAGVVLLAVGIYLIVALRRPASIRLTPVDLVIVDGVSTRRYPWIALRPAPSRFGGVGPNRLRLSIDRPDLVRISGLVRGRDSVDLVTSAYGVDSAFLIRAVGYYLDHPAERPGIGTVDGYRRLLADLAIDPGRAGPARRWRPALGHAAVSLLLLAPLALLAVARLQH